MTTHPIATDAVSALRPAAIVAGNYRPSLAAARELNRMGYRIVLGAEPDSIGAEASRFVDEVWPLPDVSLGGDALRTAFRKRLAEDPSISVIVPMTEGMLNRIDEIRSAIPNHVLLAAPQHEVLRICHDKFTWLEFCRDAGIPTPAFATASSLAQIRQAVDSIGGPVVVRPTEAGKRIGKLKAVTLQGSADIADAFPKWPDGLGALLIQKRFEGDRYNVYFGAHRGIVIRELHSRSLRTDRWDGSGQTVEGTVIECVSVHSEMVAEAVAALGYTGIGCAQFLRDPATGEACFLEINPRFGASHRFVERAGFELTKLAVELADPDFAQRPQSRPLRKVRFVWTYGDVSGLIFSIRQRSVSPLNALRWAWASLAAAIRADVHVTWSWSDPIPTIRFYLTQMFGKRPKARADNNAATALKTRGGHG